MSHITDVLSHRELRGPRNITSSNVDRMFDNNGRVLLIEEKGPNEIVSEGQKIALQALANLPAATVWLVRGTPDALRVDRVRPRREGYEVLLDVGDWEAYQRLVGRWFGIVQSEPCGCTPALGTLCEYHADRESLEGSEMA